MSIKNCSNFNGLCSSSLLSMVQVFVAFDKSLASSLCKVNFLENIICALAMCSNF